MGHPLQVVLCWHMHQPDYRHPTTGEWRLPWVYLHATKDYVDMAAHIEAVAGAKAVVNFSPVLLDQLAAYRREIRAHLERGDRLVDPLLAALADPAVGRADPEGLIRSCLRAHEHHVIQRFPAYRRLAEIARWFLERPDDVGYLSDAFLGDLVTWFHLGWLGETVRQADSRVATLEEKATGFTAEDRRTLLQLILEQLESIEGRYRRLAERGQVELCMNPCTHPLAPLLLDFGAARDAEPELPLPACENYPGGADRLRWHIERGRSIFHDHFGMAPRGCWPPEGGVSGETLRILGDAGFEWAATGEGVLGRSLAGEYARYGEPQEKALCHPYRLDGSGPACFFRDDELSDRIGFVYGGWDGDAAVDDLVGRLEGIADACGHQTRPVVPIILDGENAWDNYPHNGFAFLRGLYEKLAAHPSLDLTTFSECLDRGTPVFDLPRMVAGSWVAGTLSTWIGHPDKNRAWEMLVEAKRAFDAAASELSEEQRKAAEWTLALCEGSDWCWWFGDENPAESVRTFDRLYRTLLRQVYERIGRQPPPYLDEVVSHGSETAAGGVMRRATGVE